MFGGSVTTGSPGFFVTEARAWTYKFDTILNSWVNETDMNLISFAGVAGNCFNKIVIAAGVGQTSLEAETQIYDPVLKIWTTVADTLIDRIMPSGCVS